VGDERIEDLGCESAGAAHAFETVRPMQLDHAVARLRAIVSCNTDVLSHAS
jgi:hypothetical protein